MTTIRSPFRLAAVLAAIALVVTTPLTAHAQKKGGAKNDADGKNNLAGRARWEWKLLDDKGKTSQTGTFMGYKSGDIKHGKKQELIGTYKIEGDGKITATFTEGVLKGELKLTLVERRPVKYDGELTRADGSKAKVVLEIIND